MTDAEAREAAERLRREHFAAWNPEASPYDSLDHGHEARRLAIALADEFGQRNGWKRAHRFNLEALIAGARPSSRWLTPPTPEQVVDHAWHFVDEQGHAVAVAGFNYDDGRRAREFAAEHGLNYTEVADFPNFYIVAETLFFVLVRKVAVREADK
ncbi:MAG TPA: hypothetical protein VMX33_15130 [bacterium]|nr:hypothetical protein [bacterium]